ncbi:MAG: hypothetical protein FJX54_08200 [Alphaproteobacteria bacterium]|nr:hypothetical protein [Alphaproteobacteria bacterium]
MTAGESRSAAALIADAIEAASRQDVPRIIVCLKAAASVEPALAMTAIRMAEIALQTSGAHEAHRWLARARSIEPGDPALPVVLGQAFLAEARQALRDGAIEVAGERLRKGLALDPADPGALLDLAAALPPDGAGTVLRRSLASRIWSSPFVNLGNIAKGEGRLTSAIGAYRQAIALAPAEPRGWNNLATTLRDTAEVPAALIGYRRALAASPMAAMTESNLLQCLQFDPSIGDEALAAAHRAWAARHAKGLEEEDRRPFVNSREPDRRLSIGYVSPDLGLHPVGFFLFPVLAAHDRARVSVACYATRDLGDGLTEAIRDASDAWIDASRMDDAALAHRIREDRIDILVDLSGHTAHHRLQMFARRPAPVQATWLGYFDGTGLPQIDCMLTDAWEVPADRRDRFVEEVVALPAGRFAYHPPSYAPAPAQRGAGDAINFGCFNNLGKLSEDTIALWARLLASTPGARLLLKWASLDDAGVRSSIAARFKRYGITGDRLILRGATPHAAMLAEYGDVDVALDPFPFSGCLTTVEALWMGVPVVTRAGSRPVSRQSAAILWRLDLHDLVAADDDAYIAVARRLALDGSYRARLRDELRERMRTSTLLDGRAVAASVEEAYRLMWRRYVTPDVR